MDKYDKEIQDKLDKLAKIQESNRKAIKKHLEGKKQKGYIQVSAFITSQNKAKLDLIKQVYNHKNYNQTLDLLIDSFNLESDIKPIDQHTESVNVNIPDDIGSETEGITSDIPTISAGAITETASPEIVDNYGIVKPDDFDNWKQKDKKQFTIQLFKKLLANNVDNKGIVQVLVNTGINSKADLNNVRVYKSQNKKLLEVNHE